MKFADALDKPTVAILGSAGSTLLALLAEAVAALPNWIAILTGICGAGTALLVLLFWLRKFVIQLLHDIAAFRKGKLPKVDTSEPNK